jgi:hypothetical protein
LLPIKVFTARGRRKIDTIRIVVKWHAQRFSLYLMLLCSFAITLIKVGQFLGNGFVWLRTTLGMKEFTFVSICTLFLGSIGANLLISFSAMMVGNFNDKTGCCSLNNFE